MRTTRTVAIAAVAALAFSACGGGDDTPDESGSAASVEFVTPQDGDTVSSPVQWEARATNYTIEAAGEVTEGAGHLHILVDQDCVTAGETIGKDEGQNHFGDGSTEGTLDLEPGEHTLCLQVADGAHVATDITHEVTITVE